MCSLELTNDSNQTPGIVIPITTPAKSDPLVPTSESPRVVRNRPDSSGVNRSRPESFGVVRSRWESAGVIGSRSYPE